MARSWFERALYGDGATQPKEFCGLGAAFPELVEQIKQTMEMEMTEKKMIPVDRILELIPAQNGGWVVEVSGNGGRFAFTDHKDMLKALVDAFNAASRTEAVAMSATLPQMSAVMPGVPLYEMPRSVAEAEKVSALEHLAKFVIGGPLIGQQMEGWIRAAQHWARMAMGEPEPAEKPVDLDEGIEVAGLTYRTEGRFLRDLHLEHGDVVKATTMDVKLDVMPGETYRVKRDPRVGWKINTNRGYLDSAYTGARFVVVHRAPKSEAL